MAQLAHIETIVILQSVDLFSFCKAEEVLRVAAISQEKQYAAGESIFRRNDLADRIYCLVRGEVALEAGPSGSVGAAEAATETLRPLCTFGVLEILSGKLRTSSATALTDTLLLVLDADDFFDLLSNNIEIVKALFSYVVRELQKTQLRETRESREFEGRASEDGAESKNVQGERQAREPHLGIRGHEVEP